MFATKLFLGLLVFVFLSDLSHSELDGDKKLESELDDLAKEIDNLKGGQTGFKGFFKKLRCLRKIFHKKGGDGVKKGTIKKLKEKASQILKDETIRAKLTELMKKREDGEKLTEDDWKELKAIADDYYQRNPVVHQEVKTLLKSKQSSGKFAKVIKSILKLPLKIAKWIYNIIVALIGEAAGLALIPVAIACFFVFGFMNLFTLFSSDILSGLAAGPLMVAFGLTMFSLTPSDMNLMRVLMIGVDRPYTE